MSNDTQNIDKVKSTLAKIILGVIIAPLAIYSTIWLFTTVMATSQSVAIAANGMDKMVSAVQSNTKAVKDMSVDNVAGHANIASMVHEVELAVGQSTVRIDTLFYEIHKMEEHTIKHEENLPIWERWKTRVDVRLGDVVEDTKACQRDLNTLKGL